MSNIPLGATVLTDISEFRTVNVSSLSAFKAPVGNRIPLEEVAYNFTKPIDLGTLDGFSVPTNGNFVFTTENSNTNNLTFNGTGALFTGATGRFFNGGVDLISTAGGTGFDLTAGVGVAPILFMKEMRIQGFDKVGVTDGVLVALENVGYIFNDEGWDLRNAGILQVAEQNILLSGGISYKISGTTGSIFFNTIESAPISTATTFDISGTVGAAFFNGVKVKPISGGSVFNIDSGIVVNGAFQIIGGSIDTSAGGTMFKAGSLDQTDPQIIVQNVFNAKDSYVVGLMVMIGNTTATTINTQGVYEDIAGTIVGAADNQRFTFSVDTLTYTGLEDIIAAIDISLFMRRDIAAASRVMKFGLFLNGVLNQEVEATMSDAITNSSFPTGINLVTGDTLKMKVQNTQDTADVIITTYDFRVIEA